MIELTRTVRIGLDPAWTLDEAQSRPRLNTHAGWPSLDAPGTSVEIEICCRGSVDESTGYLMNIAEIDAAVRTSAIEILLRPGARWSREWPVLLAECARDVSSRLPSPVQSATLRVSPMLRFTVLGDDMTTAILTQQFEFSASHRLHCDSLSPEENRRLFGKCNSANGHGHNYQVDVSVRVDPSRPIPVGELERLVNEVVVTRFDHKHLNLDTAEFRSLNPSVENIARICYELLKAPLGTAGGHLASVTVWETQRTRATFPAGN